MVAARLEPRCSYCVYTPDPYGRDLQGLLVYVHGQGRRFQYLVHALRRLAEALRLVVVCPLFPGNILRDGNLEGYKYLREGDLRYDEILLDIVDEIQEGIALPERRFFLGGYSGGAQFAHRFCYLHGRRVKAVSVAAPGSVTLPQPELPWWPGIGSIDEALGKEADLAGLEGVPMQLVVGTFDDDPGDARFAETNRYWCPDAAVAGATRVERLRTLHRALEERRLGAELELVPGVGHSFAGLLPSIESFFARVTGGTPRTGRVQI